MSGSLGWTRLALISCLILSGPSAVAQARPAWPSGSDDPLVGRAQAARDLAYAYLNLWSAPNQVTLASASSFYGPTVTFHGTTRTISSVLAEKRRFAERWPDRNYRHRPETTQVACKADGDRCTVRSSFDFDAGNPRQRQRALGIGEHELVVSFSSGRPVIESENSRVIRRGHGNMTWLLRAGVGFAAPVDLEKLGMSIRLPEQRAAPSSSAPELKAPVNAVARCGDFLTAQARELGSDEVSVSGAGPEVRSPDGAVSVLINARIGYAREGKKQVRQARVTCRINPGGRVVALH